MSRQRNYGRILMFASAAIAVLVALVVVTSVIPPVSADTYPGAASSGAIPAFWFITAVNLVAAGVLFGVARTSERGGYGRRVVTGVAGVVVLLLTLGFVDAGVGYRDHGPALSLAATLLLVCAVAEVVAGALALIATFLPRRVGTGPNQRLQPSPAPGE